MTTVQSGSASTSMNERYILVVRVLCPLPDHMPAVHPHHDPRYDDEKTKNGDDGVGSVVKVERTTSHRWRVAAVGHATLCARYYALLSVRIRRFVVIIDDGETADGTEGIVEPDDSAAHAEANWQPYGVPARPAGAAKNTAI